MLGRISELQEEVSRRKNHIAQLDHQIHTLNENISILTKELELKGKEVLKIRSEANQQIRYDSTTLTQYNTTECIHPFLIPAYPDQGLMGLEPILSQQSLRMTLDRPPVHHRDDT